MVPSATYQIGLGKDGTGSHLLPKRQGEVDKPYFVATDASSIYRPRLRVRILPRLIISILESFSYFLMLTRYEAIGQHSHFFVERAFRFVGDLLTKTAAPNESNAYQGISFRSEANVSPRGDPQVLFERPFCAHVGAPEAPR